MFVYSLARLARGGRGRWVAERLAHDAQLAAFPFDFGSASIDASVTAEDFQAEYLRLFEIGNGSGPAASNYVAGALAS